MYEIQFIFTRIPIYIVMYGESPYAKGSNSKHLEVPLCWRVTVADQQLTGRHTAPPSQKKPSLFQM